MGIVGAFLPVLPTTPFVLLAAICYVRSSPKLYARLMQSRLAGRHVKAVLAGHGIPLSVKIFSVALSFCMIGYVSAYHTESLLVRTLLGILFVVQVYFMIRIKTLRIHHPSQDPQSLLLESTNELPDVR